MNDALINRYRPTSFDEVIGQKEVVKSLRETLAKKSSRSFLLVGPSGTGKTTLARIIAKEVGCHPKDLIEVDAATYTGIDDMRGVINQTAYRGLQGSPVKVVLVDEVHAASKSSVQALLKSIEEPPPHVYWILATTEGDKVPEAIRTRCTRYTLTPVDDDEILDLVLSVAEKEKIKAPEEVLGVVARKAQGSPRRALSGLAACASATSKAEALEILREVDTDDADVWALTKALLFEKASWDTLCAIVQKLDTRNPESVRIVLSVQVSNQILKGKNVQKGLEILSAFEKPYPQQSGVSALLLSLGRITFSE